MLTSNINSSLLDEISLISSDIEELIVKNDHPELYIQVSDLIEVRNFIHCLDLLETLLTHFKINSYLAKIAMSELSKGEVNGLAGEFWQIDIEHFYAANMLELCYQLSNSWKEIEEYGNRNKAFCIFKGKHIKPNDIILARHHATHFKAHQLLDHHNASIYSILRRPYIIENNKLNKELAKDTMPKVSNLIKTAIEESVKYLNIFKISISE